MNLDCADGGFRSAPPDDQHAPDATVDGEFHLHGLSETNSTV